MPSRKLFQSQHSQGDCSSIEGSGNIPSHLSNIPQIPGEQAVRPGSTRTNSRTPNLDTNSNESRNCDILSALVANELVETSSGNSHSLCGTEDLCDGPSSVLVPRESNNMFSVRFIFICFQTIILIWSTTRKRGPDLTHYHITIFNVRFPTINTVFYCLQ